MKKKYITTLILITIIIVVFIYLKSINKEQDSQTIIPPTPSIKSGLEGNLNVSKSFNKNDYVFPNELPTLTLVKKTINYNYANNLKNNLGLEEDLQEFKDLIEGIKYFVNSKDNFLVVTPKTSLVKYGLSTSEILSTNNKRYSDEELINIAKNFITNNNFYDEGQIKFLGINYLKRSTQSEGLVNSERDVAEIFAISFNLFSNKYEIANNYLVRAPIYVEIQRDGQIFNSEIILIDEVREGLTNYPIKNYQEFIGSLNKSKIVSLEGDYYSVSDIKNAKDIKKIDPRSVRIAYFDEGKNDGYLQPIFVIEANIELTGSSSNKALLYLPAYK